MYDYYSPSEEAWQELLSKPHDKEPKALFTKCLKNAVTESISKDYQVLFSEVLEKFNEDLADIDINNNANVGELKRSAIYQAQFILGKLPRTNPYLELCYTAIRQGLDEIIKLHKEAKK